MPNFVKRSHSHYQSQNSVSTLVIDERGEDGNKKDHSPRAGPGGGLEMGKRNAGARSPPREPGSATRHKGSIQEEIKAIEEIQMVARQTADVISRISIDPLLPGSSRTMSLTELQDMPENQMGRMIANSPAHSDVLADGNIKGSLQEEPDEPVWPGRRSEMPVRSTPSSPKTGQARNTVAGIIGSPQHAGLGSAAETPHQRTTRGHHSLEAKLAHHLHAEDPFDDDLDEFNEDLPTAKTTAVHKGAGRRISHVEALGSRNFFF